MCYTHFLNMNISVKILEKEIAGEIVTNFYWNEDDFQSVFMYSIFALLEKLLIYCSNLSSKCLR